MKPSHMCKSCSFHVEGCNICQKYVAIGSGILCMNYAEKRWFLPRTPSQEIVIFTPPPQTDVPNPMAEIMPDKDWLKASVEELLDEKLEAI